jgi:hypothetical protein
MAMLSQMENETIRVRTSYSNSVLMQALQHFTTLHNASQCWGGLTGLPRYRAFILQTGSRLTSTVTWNTHSDVAELLKASLRFCVLWHETHTQRCGWDTEGQAQVLCSVTWNTHTEMWLSYWRPGSGSVFCDMKHTHRDVAELLKARLRFCVLWRVTVFVCTDVISLDQRKHT